MRSVLNQKSVDPNQSSEDQPELTRNVT